MDLWDLLMLLGMFMDASAPVPAPTPLPTPQNPRKPTTLPQ